jgi:hypothetical protein
MSIEINSRMNCANLQEYSIAFVESEYPAFSFFHSSMLIVFLARNEAGILKRGNCCYC